MNEIVIVAARRVIVDKFSPSWIIPEMSKDSWLYYLQSQEEKGINFDRLLIKQPYKPRSTGEKSQNHHLNSHIQDISRISGNNFDSVKLAMKQMAVSEGYPFDTMDKIVVPWSETRINTQQCTILIEFIHRWAMENGITVREDGLGLL